MTNGKLDTIFHNALLFIVELTTKTKTTEAQYNFIRQKLKCSDRDMKELGLYKEDFINGNGIGKRENEGIWKKNILQKK